MEFFIDSFSGEFFVFFLGEGGDYITYNNIKESKNYMLFIKQAYQRFENLSMFHFRFLDAKIEFFNSCLKNLIFLVLQVNFFASNTINQDKIKNFLEKFFEKIFQKKKLKIIMSFDSRNIIFKSTVLSFIITLL